jgi:hypothetical protein
MLKVVVIAGLVGGARTSLEMMVLCVGNAAACPHQCGWLQIGAYCHTWRVCEKMAGRVRFPSQTLYCKGASISLARSHHPGARYAAAQ